MGHALTTNLGRQFLSFGSFRAGEGSNPVALIQCPTQQLPSIAQGNKCDLLRINSGGHYSGTEGLTSRKGTVDVAVQERSLISDTLLLPVNQNTIPV